ncbi:MAG: amidohydrolase family protein [Pseudomonadota bacterium]
MILTEYARRVVERRLLHLQQVRDTVTIDADTHPTDPVAARSVWGDRMDDPNYFHGKPISGEQLLAEMDLADVDMSVSWSNPSCIPYGDDQEKNHEMLFAANAYISDLAKRHPDRIIPAGWVDPKATGISNAIKQVQTCVAEWGFPIVKMNPAQNAYPIDSEIVIEVVDAIVAEGAVPAFHFGSDTKYTPASGFQRIAQRHPEHPIIGVHMGGGGGHFVESDALYLEARALGLLCPNIFYVLSAKRDAHIDSALVSYRAAGEPFSRNIGVASDAPYGRIAWNFGGFRGLFAAMRDGAKHTDPRLRNNPDLMNADAVQDFMGRNTADLVISIDKALLGKGA